MVNYGCISLYCNEDNFSFSVLSKIKEIEKEYQIEDESKRDMKIIAEDAQYLRDLGYYVKYNNIRSYIFKEKKYYKLFADRNIQDISLSKPWEINPAWLIMFRNKDVYKKYKYSDEMGYVISEHLPGTVFDNHQSELKLIITVNEALRNIKTFKMVFYTVCTSLTSTQEEIMNEIEILEKSLRRLHNNDLIIVDYANLLHTFQKEDFDNYNEIETVKKLMLRNEIDAKTFSGMI